MLKVFNQIVAKLYLSGSIGVKQALCNAAGDGLVGVVNCLLEIPGVRENREFCSDALNIAAHRGNLGVVDLLLEIPAAKEGCAIGLNNAAERGHLAVVNRLLKFLEKEQLTENDLILCRLGLIDAAMNKHQRVVNRFLENHDILDNYHWFEANWSWPHLSEQFISKMTEGRKIAVEIARSSYKCDLKPSTKMAFPDDMNSEYATRYAMGILSQFRSSTTSPNLIMSNVLSYLPGLGNDTNEALKLVAGRNALVESVVQEDPSTMLIKRKADKENKQSEAKRQKLSSESDLSDDEQEEVKDLKRKPENQGGNSKRLRM